MKAPEIAMKPADPTRLWTDINAALQSGDASLARTLNERLSAGADWQVLLGVSRVHQALGEFGPMLETARKAFGQVPSAPDALARMVECLIYCGEIGLARVELNAAEARAQGDPIALQHVASLYLHCAAHTDAHRCYVAASRYLPSDPALLYNLASSSIAMGDAERAEALYEQVIALRPDDFGAYQNRASLRTWTEQRNHVDQMRSVIAALPQGHPGRVPLGYALGKELEDLGEFQAAYSSIADAASQRRSRLAYQVESDVHAMAHLQMVFAPAVLNRRAPAAPLEPSCFVMGLPRSGTTLVDRILSSHSEVASLGEIEALVFSLMRQAAGLGGKVAMIERAAKIDTEQLGANYRYALAGYGASSKHLINKTPNNYLYLGLIHMALPGARVVHLCRHPLDSCFAMFKTLFMAGYPFSYCLDDLGRYYLAYHRLMMHWREHIPDSFVELRYEDLVADQAGTTRNLLAAWGLPWEDACLAFHRNSSPSATASASQVRKPIYASSVQRWRAYRRQLAPLAAYLERNGIDCS